MEFCRTMWISRKRWVRYSLPAKCSIIGIPLAVLSVILTLVFGAVIDKGNATNDANRPRWIDLDDPDLINIRTYDLLTEVGATISIGDCPEHFCFLIQYHEMDYNMEPPHVFVSIGGKFGGFDMPSVHGFGIGIPVRKGCGFSLLAPGYRLIFEIIDDRLGAIRAWGAIMKNNQITSGIKIEQTGCL